MTGPFARFSPDVCVMFHPGRAFADLSRVPPSHRSWLHWRRPLIVALTLSTSISLLTSGHFSLHLVGSAAIYWAFVPLVQIAGLVAVWRAWPEPRVVDRYFTGHGPWLLWMIAFAAYNSSAGAVDSPVAFTCWEATAAAVLVWSCWIDYRFFGSIQKLALHRAVSWTLFAGIFAGTSIWNEIAWRLGL